MKSYERVITAGPEDIDELGHVNNAVWVRWIQDMATAHWRAAADPGHVDAYIFGQARNRLSTGRLPGAGWEAPGSGGAKGATLRSPVEFPEPTQPRVRQNDWAILERTSGRRSLTQEGGTVLSNRSEAADRATSSEGRRLTRNPGAAVSRSAFASWRGAANSGATPRHARPDPGWDGGLPGGGFDRCASTLSRHQP